MRLTRRPEPFDHPEWIFELKLDGFRALAYIENHEARLVSRNGNTFASFRDLEADGCALYRLACEGDLEGIVAKHRAGLYDTRRPLWVKIKNPAYTQAQGRDELFEELHT